MTGSLAPASCAGVHTLRLRQSSDICGESGMSVAWLTPIGRVGAGGWMQVLPHLVPSSTPLHGCGAWASRKRSAPTGAAANGMPLNTFTPGAVSAPRTEPSAVRTVVPSDEDCASAPDTAASEA